MVDGEEGRRRRPLRLHMGNRPSGSPAFSSGDGDLLFPPTFEFPCPASQPMLFLLLAVVSSRDTDR